MLLVRACARANSCPRQRLQVLQAVSHSRVSHVALPVCAKEHQDSLLNLAATNSKRHSLWRLGGDPTQNQVILEINGYFPQCETRACHVRQCFCTYPLKMNGRL